MALANHKTWTLIAVTFVFVLQSFEAWKKITIRLWKNNFKARSRRPTNNHPKIPQDLNHMWSLKHMKISIRINMGNNFLHKTWTNNKINIYENFGIYFFFSQSRHVCLRIKRWFMWIFRWLDFILKCSLKASIVLCACWLAFFSRFVG